MRAQTGLPFARTAAELLLGPGALLGPQRRCPGEQRQRRRDLRVAARAIPRPQRLAEARARGCQVSGIDLRRREARDRALVVADRRRAMAERSVGVAAHQDRVPDRGVPLAVLLDHGGDHRLEPREDLGAAMQPRQREAAVELALGVRRGVVARRERDDVARARQQRHRLGGAVHVGEDPAPARQGLAVALVALAEPPGEPRERSGDLGERLGVVPGDQEDLREIAVDIGALGSTVGQQAIGELGRAASLDLRFDLSQAARGQPGAAGPRRRSRRARARPPRPHRAARRSRAWRRRPGGESRPGGRAPRRGRAAIPPRRRSRAAAPPRERAGTRRGHARPRRRARAGAARPPSGAARGPRGLSPRARRGAAPRTARGRRSAR